MAIAFFCSAFARYARLSQKAVAWISLNLFHFDFVS